MTASFTVSASDALDRIGADSTDLAEVTRCFQLASRYTIDVVGDLVVPQEVLDEAVLRGTVAQFAKVNAPNGVVMNSYDDSGNGSAIPLRVSSDPLYEIRWVLSPYVAPLGFA